MRRLIWNTVKKMKGYLVAAIANVVLFIVALAKKHNTKYLIICYPLGDTCYGLAFSKHLQSIGRCKYIVCNNQKRLIEECYPHINIHDVVFYSRKSFINELVVYCSFSHYINRFYGRFNIYATIPYAYYKKSYYIQKSYLNYLRFVFHLSSETPSIRPSVEEKECIIPKGKIAIINPYSNSMRIDNPLFWEDIAEYLLQKGFRVYTNVIKGQKAVGRSCPLDCNIFDLYNIVNQNNALFISIRSGIIDFLIGSNGQFFVVYYLNESTNSKSIRYFCNLTLWEQGKKNVFEIENTNQELKEKALQFINNCNK